MKQISTQLNITSLSQIRDNDDSIKVFGRSEEIDKRIENVLSKGLSQDYFKLIAIIETLFRSGYKTNVAYTLSNITAFFGRIENRQALANLILNTPKALESICNNSYYHQNGFQKIVLLESELFKLRYHIFEETNGIISQENIHDHRWPFVSIILSGELFFNLFKLSQNGEFEKYENEYSSGSKSKYEVKEIGKCNLDLIGNFRCNNAFAYFLNENRPHQIINPSLSRTHTLVLTGTPIKDWCKLYSENQFDLAKTLKPKIEMLDLETSIIEFQSI